MRTITGNNYIETCSDLIIAFGKALAVVADPDAEGSDEHEETSTVAFELAKECGWDFENDEDFAQWALKATGQETLVEGLQNALEAVRTALAKKLAEDL